MLRLVKLFKDFGTSLGQLINLIKFGFSLAQKQKLVLRRVKDILGVTAIPLTDKYLGAHLLTNLSKVKCFEPLIEKL